MNSNGLATSAARIIHSWGPVFCSTDATGRMCQLQRFGRRMEGMS